MITNCTYKVLELSTVSMGRPSKIYPTILQSGTDVILVDTGFPGMKEALDQALAAVNIKTEELNHILLTHHDIDHIGCLKVLTEAKLSSSGAAMTVWAHHEEVPYIEGHATPVKITMFEPKLETLPPEMHEMIHKMKMGFASAFAPVNQQLEDGAILPWGDIEVLHTPGHTPGHMCLYLPQNRTLIAGDLLTVKDDQLSLLDADIHYDLPQFRNSLKRLLNYDIQNVICYHGGVYSKAANQRIQELIENLY